MLLQELKLTNFKCHKEYTAKFSEGIIAIYGENGAGKSSILEAISWVLFNTLPYTDIKQIINVNAKTASVELEVYSPKDQQNYLITRKTSGQTATVFNMSTNSLVCEGVGKLTEWIYYQLNLPSYIKLKSISNSGIAVPQGQLTYDFLRTSSDKKKLFDQILGLDEYKTVDEKLVSLNKYTEKNINILTGSLSHQTTISSQLDNYNNQIKEISESQTKLSQNIKDQQITVNHYKTRVTEQQDIVLQKKDLEFTINTATEKIKYLQHQYDNSIEEEQKYKNMQDKSQLLIDKINNFRDQNQEYLLIDLDELRQEFTEVKDIEKKINSLKLSLNIPNINNLNKLAEQWEQDLNKYHTEYINVEKQIAMLQASQKVNKQLAPKLKEEKICPLFQKECLNITNNNSIDNLDTWLNNQQSEINAQLNQYMKDLKISKSAYQELNIKHNNLIELQDQYKCLNNRISIDIANKGKLIADKQNNIKQLTIEQTVYKEYLENNSIDQLLQTRQSINTEIQDNNNLLDKYTEQLKTMQALTNEEWTNLQTEYNNAQQQLNEYNAQEYSHTLNIKNINQHIQALIEQQEQFKKDKAQLDEYNSKQITIKEHRQFYKQASIELAKYYTYNISKQASDIFCEIMEDASYQLHWSENYDIITYKNGQKFNYEQLSGGQQVMSALSIKLGLLKELSSISFAFFDEPTAHLDVGRRSQLALQLANIKSFSQLFVITHDTSFIGQAHQVISL